jgi:hypothetical protein
MKSDGSRVKIFVYLLEEGADAWRPTEAESIGDGLFKILPTPDYDGRRGLGISSRLNCAMRDTSR